jgi:hypothetical protein
MPPHPHLNYSCDGVIVGIGFGSHEVSNNNRAILEVAKNVVPGRSVDINSFQWWPKLQ